MPAVVTCHMEPMKQHLVDGLPPASLHALRSGLHRILRPKGKCNVPSTVQHKDHTIAAIGEV